jgi:rare lipoprotein A
MIIFQRIKPYEKLNRLLPITAFFIILLLSGCATVRPGRAYTETGLATWYGYAYANRPTSSGERFDPHQLTAAHRTLPFNTYVKVTNLENGESVIVRINDRGPFVKNRIIDLSNEAAKRIHMIGRGFVKVRLDVVKQ